MRRGSTAAERSRATCDVRGRQVGSERGTVRDAARRGTLQSREQLRGDDFVTGSVRSSKRAEHAHAAVAQSRRGGRGSRLPHFVALIRFERIARARVGGASRRRVASSRCSERVFLNLVIVRHLRVLRFSIVTARSPRKFDERKRQQIGAAVALPRDSSLVRGNSGAFQTEVSVSFVWSDVPGVLRYVRDYWTYVY